MNICRKVFQKLEDLSLEKMRDSKVKPGLKEIKYHMIFDIIID